MYPGQTTVYLEIEQIIELEKMKEEIQKSGGKISMSNLISDAVCIMLNFYKEDVIRNYKKQMYFKK